MQFLPTLPTAETADTTPILHIIIGCSACLAKLDELAADLGYAYSGALDHADGHCCEQCLQMSPVTLPEATVLHKVQRVVHNIARSLLAEPVTTAEHLSVAVTAERKRSKRGAMMALVHYVLGATCNV